MARATKDLRHLHRDYGTAHCGLDASHILMTYELGETDCGACVKAALAAHDARALLDGIFLAAEAGDEAAIAQVKAIAAETERARIALAEQHAAETAQKRQAHVENLRAQLKRIKR